MRDVHVEAIRGHARARRRLAALTLDYETWQPVPAGRRIDWDADVFRPTDALLDACDAEHARLTIFAEMGEHAFLLEHRPELARRMEEQWRDAVRRGHDVQLHLHPSWLPELGADMQGERYIWNEALTRADEHPDLVGLIGRMKRALEDAIRPVDPTYEVVAFRAGGFEAQPFRRLAKALRDNELWCDSSVYHGGRQPGVHHHYPHPCHSHQPWFASHADPQLEAPPAEWGIVELPVATFARNDRWTFDTHEGAHFGERLLAAIDRERSSGPGLEAAGRIAKARSLGTALQRMAPGHRRLLNKAVPRALAHALLECPEERSVDDDFYVAVGHSKVDLDIPAIREQLRVLREGGVEILTLTQLARLAREQLEHRAAAPADGHSRPPEGARHAPAVEPERDDVRARRLRALIPLDRTRALVLGCATGDSSARIAGEHPRLAVTGVDAREPYVAAARERHAGGRVDFLVAEPSALPFADGTFDCVYAGDVLARATDVDGTLAEIARVLSDGGVLVASIPADAYGRRCPAGGHAWRASAADVRERLGHAGLLDVSVAEVDLYALGAEPNPAAADRQLYVSAWRRSRPQTTLERVDALRHWTHTCLELDHSSRSLDPARLLRAGRASAVGMTAVLGEALRREGHAPRWVTMIAREHPRGHGTRLEATHAVIEVTLPDRSVHVLDPMVDLRFPRALHELIECATLADEVGRVGDAGYRPHERALYSTSFWYRRVVALAVRTGREAPQRFVPARWAAHALDPRYRALALMRVEVRGAVRWLRSR